ITQCPMGLISLVDEKRQWFKAKIGVAESETPRDISICGHAIAEEGFFEIPDLLVDVRFHDNPLVNGNLRLRYYGGFPLIGTEGHVLGMLCVLDTRPRRLNGEQKKAVITLARQVVMNL